MNRHGSRLRGAWNQRPWTSNPLMTGSRRWEMALRLILTAVVLLSIPLVAAVGTAMNDSMHAAAARAAAETHPVEATLQADATVDASTADVAWGSILSGVGPATWTVDGVRHTEDVSTAADARAGDKVTVWLDSAGHSTDKPRTASSVTVDAVVIAVFIWTAVAGAAVVLVAGMHFAMNARRAAKWDADWAKLDSENPTSR